MNEDRIEGAATTLGGQLEKGVGDLTADRKLQGEGLTDQASGTAQNMFGGAEDAVRSALESAPPQVRETADRAMAAARKSPILATVVVGAVGLVIANLFRKQPGSYRRS